jgi:hypothetical protein
MDDDRNEMSERRAMSTTKTANRQEPPQARLDVELVDAPSTTERRSSR